MGEFTVWKNSSAGSHAAAAKWFGKVTRAVKNPFSAATVAAVAHAARSPYQRRASAAMKQAASAECRMTQLERKPPKPRSGARSQRPSNLKIWSRDVTSMRN